MYSKLLGWENKNAVVVVSSITTKTHEKIRLTHLDLRGEGEKAATHRRSHSLPFFVGVVFFFGVLIPA